jgi:hypothetical protein
MYEIPGRSDVRKCVVSAESVLKGQRPLMLTRGGQSIDIDSPPEVRGESA